MVCPNTEPCGTSLLTVIYSNWKKYCYDERIASDLRDREPTNSAIWETNFRELVAYSEMSETWKIFVFVDNTNDTDDGMVRAVITNNRTVQ